MPERGPERLTPAFHDKIWGSTRLEPWFRAAGRKVGEVWFQTEPPLPLLTKFIFTSERLSVQVHPDDVQARARGLQNGKTEMWHILRADPGAEIGLGFRVPMDAGQLRRATESGAIEHLLEWIPVEAGDTVFTPAGTVHALGSGLAVLEVQQNSDTTYRLWDYGRGRELHLEEGLAVADTGPARHRPEKSRRSDDGVPRTLVSCDYFLSEELSISSDFPLSLTGRAFQLLIVLEGRGFVGSQEYCAGEVWLLRDGVRDCHLLPRERSRLLLVGPPAGV